ncbi:VOC family protein [Corynebacterium guangdongense]|uniref:Enzyme related to lactoylglutathione lyase n=1 Tax=Corynebacterium guangdongense TaxID=1783348 RepID=A0ABU2A0R9_9CORY|nr:VOC family protein [Corynebacterium guangdongense]MDR7330761.1 putative enzyme related to lactoylglutathione lyase [Corynebacterium guangdongense]WJZ16776.1 27 kDa antigen Cfp30B [Corynebacterium guangdongense]
MTTTHGDPIYTDLFTRDLAGAVHFYSTLFGWDIVDSGPEFGHYHLASYRGTPVAGMMSSLFGPEGPSDTPLGPTAWGVSLHVTDIDATAEEIVRAGGGITSGPMEVGDLGISAQATDPAGAGFGLWQPSGFRGIDGATGPHVPSWFEVMSTDYDAACAFYTDVFGWTLTYTAADGSSREEPGAGDFRYATNTRQTAGICDASGFSDRSYWRHYLPVDDVDAAAVRLSELGGTVLDGPTDSPFGRLATVADPQGANFQIITMAR